MGKVVFKSTAPFYFWKGRPQRYDGKPIVPGVKAMRFELY